VFTIPEWVFTVPEWVFTMPGTGVQDGAESVFQDGPAHVVKHRVAPQALEELKQRIRASTRRNGGRSLTQVASELGRYLRGWRKYFHLPRPGDLCGSGWLDPQPAEGLQLKQWKRGRATFRELGARGVPEWLVLKGPPAMAAAGGGRRLSGRCR